MPRYSGLTTAELFDQKVYPEPMSGCFLWSGAADPQGYGRLKIAGRTVKSHRYAFERAKGPIPAGMAVLHRCDTPACVNPTHLFLGDEKANAQDMVRKGRNRGGWLNRYLVGHSPRTHCRRGHEFSPENTALQVGGRRCRECRRASYRARYALHVRETLG